MGLLEELKRRRVFRVTAAYVVGALAVLQGADALFPALHLPPSSVTVVAVVVVLGFPLALLLGWAFDVTPGGVTRTPGSLRFPVRSAVLATLVLAAAVTAFIALRRHAVAARLDKGAVAVLPFRVSGDASLAGMREGMVDLLAVKLTGEGGGPRALDSRTTLSAWRREVGDEKDDLTTGDAVQLARKLGAGEILLGSVVGTPGQVAVSVALHSSVDGGKLASAEDAARPDSILPLVDRLVAKLLSQQAGEGRRAEALLSESLPAVRAYLDGQQRLRRGEYVSAMQRFNSALEQDSTFALAAVGLAHSASWTEDVAEWTRGEAVALKYRERLPLPDREFVDVAFGYPDVKPALERIRLFKDMVARAPDRIEAWHHLGEMYFHYGSVIGVDDPNDEALAAWRHALALDSTYMPALEHQVDIFAQRGDTANVRRVANLMERIQPNFKYSTGNGWAAALVLHDTAWLRQLRAGRDTMNPMALDIAGLMIVEVGAPQQDLPWLIGGREHQEFSSWQPFTLATIGRPQAALADTTGEARMGADFRKLIIALVHTEVRAPEMLALARQAVASNRGGGAAFMGAEYCLENSDMQCAEEGAAVLRRLAANLPGSVPARTVADRRQLTVISAALLDAGLEIRKRAPGARAALARADSLMVHTSMSEQAITGEGTLFALTSTRDHLALGDWEGAYVWAKRGANVAFGFVAHAPLLLEYARAAAHLDKRDEAIAAYLRYLAVRPQPEPGGASAVVAQARQELALLTGEPRSRSR